MPNNRRVEQECFWMANLRRIRKNCSLFAALSVLFLAAVFYHPSAWSATIITSDIDVNTTWTFDNGPYIIDTALSINSGATLIIDAEIEVRFRPGTSMSVASGGTLRVNGDPGKPVVFTSDAVAPAAGDWVSVNILAGGSASFDYCEIAYAGQGGGTGALTISSAGIVTLDQCDIHHNVDYGAQISGGAGVSPVFTDVIIRDNGDGAVEQGGDTSPEYANVTLTGNGEDGVLLIGDYSTTLELDGSGLNGAHFTPNTSININAGGEVTVTAGTTLAFAQDAELNVNNGGDLQVNGTPGNPVVFTSNASSPAPGDWRSVDINIGGAASFSYCSVAFGGRLDVGAVRIYDADGVTINGCDFHNNQAAAIEVGANAQALLTNDLIHNNGMAGIDVLAGAEVTAHNNSVVNNGIGVNVVNASLSLANNIISHNGTAGIDASPGAAVQMQYNDLYNPSGVNVIGLSDPTGVDGNISADPLFFDLNQQDFRLDYDSPAVDAGTSVATPVIDFLARTRFDNTAVPDTGSGVPGYFDMGALEQYCYAPLEAPPPGGNTSGGLENDTYCIMFRDGFEG
jgi:hypothetical protein